MALILIANGPMPTTAALVSVTTGTSLKTLLQLKASATLPMRIVEWGISFDGFAAAAPGKVELIETDVAATVTAHVAADLHKYDADAIACGDLTSNLIQVGVNATGYTSSGEGSITAVRYLAGPQLIAPTNQFIQPFAPGREPIIQPGKYGRIRVNFGTAINAYCYAIVSI